MSLFYFIILFSSDYTKNEKLYNYNLAINLDDKVVSDFPAKGNYSVNVACENAIGKWLYDTWELDISNISGNVSCNINFSTVADSLLLKDYVISLASQVPKENVVYYENGYRYQGAVPNNYILFNNELWRIIGAIDTKIFDGTTKILTKIVRDKSIGTYVRDKSFIGQWEGSSLYDLLNNYYYYSHDGSNSENCVAYILSVGFYKSAKCDFVNQGLKSSNLIENVYWNNGWFSLDVINVDNIFYEESTLTTLGKVGLMNVSDIGYSVSENVCERSGFCNEHSWAYTGYSNWLINTNSNNGKQPFILNATGIIEGGYYLSGYAAGGYDTKPVVYLKDTVKYIGGTGSINDPIIIDM